MDFCCKGWMESTVTCTKMNRPAMTKSHCVFVPWRPAFPQFVNGTTCAINTDAYRQPCGYRLKSLQVPSWSHEVKLWDCSYATVALQQIICISLCLWKAVCLCLCGVWSLGKLLRGLSSCQPKVVKMTLARRKQIKISDRVFPRLSFCRPFFKL